MSCRLTSRLTSSRNTRNILYLQLIRVCALAYIAAPQKVTYMMHHGLTKTQAVLILTGVGGVVAVLAQIPTGWLADRQLKWSIALGGSAMALAYGAYSIGGSIGWFVVYEVFIGLGMAAIAAGPDVLLRETDLAMGGGPESYTARGRVMQAIEGYSEAAATAIGALLVVRYHADLRVLMILQALVFVALTYCSLRLHRPTDVDELKERIEPIALLRSVKDCLANRSLRWQLLFAAVASNASLTMVWLTPVYLLQGQWPETWLSLPWAALCLAQPVGHLLGHWVRALTPWETVRALAIVSVVTYGLLGFVRPCLCSFLLIFPLGIVRSLQYPLNNELIQRQVPYGMRATVLSVREIGQWLLYLVLGSILVLCTGQWSILHTMQVAAVLYAALFGVTLWKIRSDLPARLHDL